MASKSKDVRIEQLRIFEKKLAVRLQQLEQKGISPEKAQNDAIVKSLKAKIKQTKVRIATFDKFVQQTQALAQAKAAKQAAVVEEVKASAEEAKPKAKKKEDGAEKEPKKQPAAEDGAAKKAKKQPADGQEAAPKKAKKQPDEGDDAAPKKKATKKKEE